MSKVSKDRTAPHPRQLGFLPDASVLVSDEGRLAGVVHAVRAALVQAIKRSPLSRYQIAGRMSELLARDVSKEMLDKYTAESADAHRLPVDVAAAFCVATHSTAVLDVLAEAAGCVVVCVDADPAQALPLELRSGMLRVTRELGEAAAALEEALQDGCLSRAEAGRCRRELRDLIQQAVALSQQLAREERVA